MIALLDVNVLVALAWPNHVHHEAAHRWFAGRHKRDGWATCSLTEGGFVRVSSNPALPQARSPREALELLRRMVAIPGHHFWSDDVSLARDEVGLADRIVGHRQVTDAHLLRLAIRREGRLATFDRGVAELVPASLEGRGVVELIG